MRFVLSGFVLAAAVITTSSADARHRHGERHLAHHVQAMTPHGSLGIDYRHNYGPGQFPGTIGIYDGSPNSLCRESAASYRGQDGRLYPCS